MPYASHRDRDPHDLELRSPAFPVAPLNMLLLGSRVTGVYDLCWDDPAGLAANSAFTVLGVNVYRSFDSEFGPFFRLTELPLGAGFYRDQTDNELVVEELVEDSQWVLRGEAVGGGDEPKFVFRTLHYPIVAAGSQGITETNPAEVRVTIDGLAARVRRVSGAVGEVEIETRAFPDVGRQTRDPSPIPTDASIVRVSYRYNRSLVRTDLFTRVFYRVTTIGIPVNADLDVVQPQDILETPLERAAATNSRELEKTDYIWREGVRRNQWILQQSGERVQVFLRKTVGQRCGCYSATHKQALSDCVICYGTGIVGGYEGPYPVLIGPDDAERRLNQGPRGLNGEHVSDVFMGPAPIVSQRDFIVKINGDRYSIGAVRMPTNRGMLLQQHFNIGHLDEKDIRASVPLDGMQSRDRVGHVMPPHFSPPVITDKPNIPDERELRGRTKTWENLTY
jgi:hypothetical protein